MEGTGTLFSRYNCEDEETLEMDMVRLPNHVEDSAIPVHRMVKSISFLGCGFYHIFLYLFYFILLCALVFCLHAYLCEVSCGCCKLNPEIESKSNKCSKLLSYFSSP